MSIGIRHDDLRKRNRAMVISAVRRAVQPSRTEIVRATELSHSTISAIAADLISEGILVEAKGEGASSARRGRPQVALALSPQAATVVTAVLSLNILSVALVDYAGSTIREVTKRLPTLTMAKQELISTVMAAVSEIIAGHAKRGGPILRISLAVQGITDSEARTLLWSPITPHRNVEFGAALEKAFGLPVTVHNDCNMITVALNWRDPERYGDNFIAILLSHGIGMGLMLKGRLFTGPHSSAGEFGHMIHKPDGALCRCGRNGCIEAYAGNYAIWRKARGTSEYEPPPSDIDASAMEELAQAARSREGIERDAFRAAGEAIGFGIGGLFALIDPAPVAIVGQGVSAFDILEPVIREAIGKTAGGQHSAAISFDTDLNEMPLIREGCAMTALTSLDHAVFGAGAAISVPRRDVA
ncbi:putative NBD/HSP70 family sugar kinase [Mesorhizobium sp. J18]|uniref:ROK family protein n=1 Tax=Mesorhizobium sp. J18 TaxID=935263 RepID=UPI001198E2C3|nr:ROK family protein [Mesorhizobium sp. J18]TWG98055.1 putative NBD/HSP70 family sugar kinase [Mesorhizobium sp. J18]